MQSRTDWTPMSVGEVFWDPGVRYAADTACCEPPRHLAADGLLQLLCVYLITCRPASVLPRPVLDAAYAMRATSKWRPAGLCLCSPVAVL